MKKIPPGLFLIFFILISLGAGILGSLATYPEIEGWYRGLAKPSWNPPDSWFGPVWTTLYVMMGTAAWLVWRRGGFAANKGALGLFAVQLILNSAWSFIFFRAHQLAGAFVEIVILWVAILATMIAFLRRSRVAGWLFAPYLAWVSFAMALNYAIWQLNA